MGSPTRQDGRVEVGQKISTAFSARAWNRAQEAADIVLGDKPRFGAEAPILDAQSLFRSVLFLQQFIGDGSPAGNTYFRRSRFAMIVDHTTTTLNTPAASPPAGTGLTYCQLFAPVPFANRRTTAGRNFAVVVRGELTGSQPGTSKATVCTHGLCLAMVRKNPGGFLPKVRPAVIRYSSDTFANLIGIAEDSDCGAAELVAWTTIKPFSQERQQAEGIDPAETMDATLNNVYYAVVRL